MFVKRYLAADMHQAMEQIRKELGSDAVILSNRPVRKKGILGFFQKKQVEVMVACETPAEKAKRTADPLAQALSTAPKPAPRTQAQAPSSIAAAAYSAGMATRSQTQREAPAPEAPRLKEARKEGAAFVERIPDSKPAPQQRAEGATLPADKIDMLAENLAELKDVVRALAGRIGNADQAGEQRFSPEVTRFQNGLVDQATHRDIALKLCERMQIILEKVKDEPKKVAETLLLDMLGEPAPLRLKNYAQTVVMLVGPTGVGKTTTLVKLAGRFSLSMGLKVGFINADTFRVAAQEQIKTYADIMEIPCITVYSPADMAAALASFSDRDVILVDTAGKSTGDPAYHDEIRRYIAECKADEVLLAVSASMSPTACHEMIENYSFLDGYKIVITKLDEVRELGYVLNIVDYAKKPIAYITNGQNVPQDIMEPDLRGIAFKLLEGAGV